MDVIALAEHGFETAVAPMGTALTQENQLAMLWRVGPEPILCFDGDDCRRQGGWAGGRSGLAVAGAGPFDLCGLSSRWAWIRTIF